jgi:hypothetical protein
MDEVGAGHYYVLQQDGTSCPQHQGGPGLVHGNLPEFWPMEVWPLSSPACNPLDYYLWSLYEQDVNKALHNSATSFVDGQDHRCDGQWSPWPRPAEEFEPGIEAVVDAGSNFSK